jgi:hypothetical protein
MTNKKKYNPVIANAIVWAALIIVTSLLLADAIDSQKSWFLTLLQIAGWFATNLIVVKGGRSAKGE